MARIRGALLVLGSNPDTANVYEVVAGAFRALTSLPSGSRVADVAADRAHIVITDNARTHADHVDSLEGSQLTDVGLGAAFGPAMSGTGGLAWVALEGGAPTPGITKPKSFVLGVRASLLGASRTVYRTPSSLASPQWIGPHTVVVAASDGVRTRLLRVDTITRATKVLATIASSDALDLTAGTAHLTAWDGSRAVVVSFTGRTVGRLPSGWRPLCWLPSGPLLASRGGLLGTIAVSGSRVGGAQILARAPAGQAVYAASCARVT